MKILLTGSTGYVGKIIKTHFEKKYDITGVSSSCLCDKKQIQCDLTDQKTVLQLANSINPDIIIHAAGNKNIAYCEKNPEDAFRINCNSIKNIVAAFGRQSRIIYISTDYVFDGQRGYYKEHDQPNPVSVYGKSKLCGESESVRIGNNNSFTILRLSALYDLQAIFPRFLFEKLSNNKFVECFTNVKYSPTYYKDFLVLLEKIVNNKEITENIFHACGEAISRYDFALAFAEVFGFNEKLITGISKENNTMFLFPDLSMSNERTKAILDIKTTSLKHSLQEMKMELTK
ncbi:MAG: SDR family oxidoreductase [Nitrospiraceae bacterium]|nr:SDR family oxidoreductase [Nitrospiraceae bacterium]